jgi:hypothetical protein
MIDYELIYGYIIILRQDISCLSLSWKIGFEWRFAGVLWKPGALADFVAPGCLNLMVSSC